MKSPLILLKKNAPINAAIEPGIASFKTDGLWTFLNFKCDVPAAAVVRISAKWTVADAIAGATPNVSNTDADEAPYPIPREPSTNSAKNPAKANIIILFM